MKNNYKINDFTFTFTLDTRWRDLDAFQHVNNAEYATYIESARVDLFERWGIPGSNTGKSIIMASLKIDYLAQLKHPTSMIIGQRISRLGSTSFDIESVVFDESGVPVCHAVVVAVCFDFNKQIPIPVYSSVIKDYEK